MKHKHRLKNNSRKTKRGFGQSVKEPLISKEEIGGSGVHTWKTGRKNAWEQKKRSKKELFQLQFASFFRFIAAYLSLTHPVTRAKPLWCV